MRRMLVLTLVILLIGSMFNSCQKTAVDEDLNDGRLKIVTTIFPLYDFAGYITDHLADVSILIPPGVEVHSYEPTPRDIINIKDADIFIFIGKELEPWVEKITDELKNSDLVIIEAGKGIDLIEHEHDEDEDHDDDEEDGDHDEKDPHIWLDPVLTKKIVDNILGGMRLVDIDKTETYEKNALSLKEKLDELHAEYLQILSNVRIDTIIYAGHFAFGYMTNRYGLHHISPYAGFSPNAEPTPQRVAELIKRVEQTGSKYIFYEEMINPRIAEIISKEAGVEMLLLHGAHNVSSDDIEKGITYFDIMRQNLERLKTGLEYNE